MKDRIRKLRKALDLTQREFAERIGMKSNTIATYEMGRAVPSDPTINNICKEFGASERWVRYGEGDMFVPAPSSELDAALMRIGSLTDESRMLIKKIASMNREEQETVTAFLRLIVMRYNDVREDGREEPTLDEYHAEVDRRFGEEKEAVEKSEA